MKTPDEIKKGLALHEKAGKCNECPYTNATEFKKSCFQIVASDALAYIQQLESRIAQAGFELNPLERQGLYGKYTVINNATGKAVEDCFVLLPFKDPVAWKAVRFYADHTDKKQLAIDLYKWTAPQPLNAKEG